MFDSALTDFVFTEELFKEVDKLEEEAAYAAFVAVAGAVFLCIFGSVGSGVSRLFKCISATVVTLIVAVVINV